MRTPRIITASARALLLAAALLGCGEQAPPPRQAVESAALGSEDAAGGARGSRPDIHLHFEPDSLEDASLFPMIAALQRRTPGLHLTGADLYRYGGTGADRRFLLHAAHGAAGIDPGQWGAVVYVLHPLAEPPVVSEPLELDATLAEAPVLGEIADFDGDGADDVAFCSFPDGVDEEGTAGAFGFRNGALYPILAPTRPLPPC